MTPMPPTDSPIAPPPTRRLVPRALAIAAGVLAVAAVATVACAPRRSAEAVLLLGSNHARTADVAYGEGARRRLDVYRPRRATADAPAGALPVIVFLYGGRWRDGGKEDYRVVAGALVRRGFVVVVPDTRLHPDTVFPGWVEDAARAIRWTHDHASAYGGDTSRIVVVGHSAGAHTAVLLALDARHLADAGLAPGAVAGVAALAGPIDTVWTDPDVQQAMGPRERWPSSYPVNFIERGAAQSPPLLLLHGADDETVLPAGSARFAERVRNASTGGGCVRSRTYAGVGHVSIVVALAAPALRIAPVLDDVEAFARRPVATTCPTLPRDAGR